MPEKKNTCTLKNNLFIFVCWLLVTIDEIQVQEDHGVECGFRNIYTVAEHYNIYQDLYGDAYFYPQMQLRIAYDIDEEFVNPVCTGNILDPAEVWYLKCFLVVVCFFFIYM